MMKGYIYIYIRGKCVDVTQIMSNDCECRSLMSLETVQRGHFKEPFWRPVSGLPDLRVLCL